MNSKLLIAIAVILLLGGGAFFLSNRNKSETSQSDTTVNVADSSEESVLTGRSLKDMLAAGVSQSCTFSDLNDDMNITGTTYVSGGKVRADYEAMSGTETSSGHMIYDGKVSYIWADGETSGIMAEIDPAEVSAEGDAQGFDINKEIDYSCEVWLPDQSKFEPPSDVTFSSFTLPVGGSNGTGTTGTQNLCASCDSLTGDQKTQCMTALNCN